MGGAFPNYGGSLVERMRAFGWTDREIWRTFGAKKRRARLLKRLCESQNQRCAYCRRRFHEHGRNSKPSLDHLQAKAHGGVDSYENCVAACVNCNQKRGLANPSEFARRFAHEASAIGKDRHHMAAPHESSRALGKGAG